MSSLNKEKDSRKYIDISGPLYVIISDWALSRIHDFICQYGDSSDIGPIRIDYKNGVETNRTFVVLKPYIFDALWQAGYSNPNNRDEFYISKYRMIDTFKLDRRSLKIPLPASLRMTGTVISNIIKEKLDTLVKFNVLASDDFNIRMVLADRARDIPPRFAYINFTEKATVEQILACHIIMHQTKWSEDSDVRVECKFMYKVENNPSTYLKEGLHI